jgi:hypothetical protein
MRILAAKIKKMVKKGIFIFPGFGKKENKNRAPGNEESGAFHFCANQTKNLFSTLY